MIVNQANLGTLFQGYKASFNEGFNSVVPTWSKIATQVPSSTRSEKYGWLGQFPRLREWVGDRQIKSMVAHDYSITNKDFEATISVSRNDIEDDSYGVFTPLMREMGFAAVTHPEELVYGLLGAGFTSLCYDGQYFFDVDHAVGNGVVSNFGGGAGSPWFLLDTRRALKPLIFQKRREYDFKQMVRPEDEAVFMNNLFRYGIDARVNVGFGFWQCAYGSKQALDANAFQTAYQTMMGFQSDEGRPLGINPSLLVCGPSGRSAALSVVATQHNAAGASNINYQAVDVLVSPWLP